MLVVRLYFVNVILYLVSSASTSPSIATNNPSSSKSFVQKEQSKTQELSLSFFNDDNLDDLLDDEDLMASLNIPEEELWWYLDLRKYGTAVHSGFGLGFERLVMFATGMSNIRDVIPYPRTPQNAEF